MPYTTWSGVSGLVPTNTRPVLSSNRPHRSLERAVCRAGTNAFPKAPARSQPSPTFCTLYVTHCQAQRRSALPSPKPADALLSSDTAGARHVGTHYVPLTEIYVEGKAGGVETEQNGQGQQNPVRSNRPKEHLHNHTREQPVSAGGRNTTHDCV